MLRNELKKTGAIEEMAESSSPVTQLMGDQRRVFLARLRSPVQQ